MVMVIMMMVLRMIRSIAVGSRFQEALDIADEQNEEETEYQGDSEGW